MSFKNLAQSFPLILLLASRAAFGTEAPATIWLQAFRAVDASHNHNSNDRNDALTYGQPIEIGLARTLSFQCKWAGVGGVLNSTVSLETSNDLGVTWTAKSGAIYTVSGASGNQDVSLTNATEKAYRLVYTAGTVTMGTISCFVFAK